MDFQVKTLIKENVRNRQSDGCDDLITIEMLRRSWINCCVTRRIEES